MTDRESRYPGRYRAVMSASDVAQMQAGNQFSITLVRDDDPIDPGTPFSKETILPDSLIEYLGLELDQIHTPAEFLQELAAQGKANSYDISILQEKLEDFEPGGGGGLTDEEFSQKAADIIYDEQANGGGPFLEALDTEACSVSESCMEDFGLLSYSEDEGVRVRNVPTYEELPQKMADAIQAEWDDGSGHLLDTLNMVALSSAYSAAESYLQDSGILSTDAYDDETGLPIRNVPTYEELDAALAEPQYELVQSVVTSGETTIFIEGIALDAFALFVEAPAGTEAKGGTVTIVKGGKNVWSPWVNNAVITAGPSHFAVYGKNEKGLAVLEYTDATSSTATQKKYLNRAPFFVEGSTPFTRVSFNCSALPAGTKAELWGIVKQNYLAEE